MAARIIITKNNGPNLIVLHLVIIIIVHDVDPIYEIFGSTLKRFA